MGLHRRTVAHISSSGYGPGLLRGVVLAAQNKDHESAGSRATAPTIREFDMADKKQISVEENGEVLAQATISAPDENNGARAEVTMAPGHLPVGTRQKMADAVHEAVCDDNARHLTATVPKGDTELVDGLRGHLSDVELHVAGASSIIQGDVDPRDSRMP